MHEIKVLKKMFHTAGGAQIVLSTTGCSMQAAQNQTGFAQYTFNSDQPHFTQSDIARIPNRNVAYCIVF